MIHNIPQPAFEQFVAEHLEKDSVVEVRKNHSFVNCEQVCPFVEMGFNHADNTEKKGYIVTTVVENRYSRETYEIRSRHVIGCDGAKSKVREVLGIECEGESTCKGILCCSTLY